MVACGLASDLSFFLYPARLFRGVVPFVQPTAPGGHRPGHIGLVNAALTVSRREPPARVRNSNRSRQTERAQTETMRDRLRLFVRPRRWDRSSTATTTGRLHSACRTACPTNDLMAASPRWRFTLSFLRPRLWRRIQGARSTGTGAKAVVVRSPIFQAWSGASLVSLKVLMSLADRAPARGYNRDGKKGKKQVNYGLVLDGEGRAISVQVYAGNVAASTASAPCVPRTSRPWPTPAR